jgi:outer membrane protein OmpA-like peptidoglycan-associated protein
MTRFTFLVLWAFLFANAEPALAQSTEDVIKALTPTTISPQPGLRGFPYGRKGLKREEPTEVAPPSIDLHIPFDFNSDKLTPDAFTILRRLGDALKDPRLAKFRFKIAGHTDAKGTAKYNQKLSEGRAKTVRDYLVFQYDIDPGRLDAVGYGMTQLADPVHPLDEINRRVQIINMSPGS